MRFPILAVRLNMLLGRNAGRLPNLRGAESVLGTVFGTWFSPVGNNRDCPTLEKNWLLQYPKTADRCPWREPRRFHR
jgi:hypothetical protein